MSLALLLSTCQVLLRKAWHFNASDWQKKWSLEKKGSDQDTLDGKSGDYEKNYNLKQKVCMCVPCNCTGKSVWNEEKPSATPCRSCQEIEIL